MRNNDLFPIQEALCSNKSSDIDKIVVTLGLRSSFGSKDFDTVECQKSSSSKCKQREKNNLVCLGHRALSGNQGVLGYL